MLGFSLAFLKMISASASPCRESMTRGLPLRDQALLFGGSQRFNPLNARSSAPFSTVAISSSRGD